MLRARRASTAAATPRFTRASTSRSAARTSRSSASRFENASTTPSSASRSADRQIPSSRSTSATRWSTCTSSACSASAKGVVVAVGVVAVGVEEEVGGADGEGRVRRSRRASARRYRLCAAARVCGSCCCRFRWPLSSRVRSPSLESSAALPSRVVDGASWPAREAGLCRCAVSGFPRTQA